MTLAEPDEIMNLSIGTTYDTAALICTGWTAGDGSGHEGYHYGDYFDGGRYLGPDQHGIEPLFSPDSAREAAV